MPMIYPTVDILSPSNMVFAMLLQKDRRGS